MFTNCSTFKPNRTELGGCFVRFENRTDEIKFDKFDEFDEYTIKK